MVWPVGDTTVAESLKKVITHISYVWGSHICTPMVKLQPNDGNTLLLLLQRQWAISGKIQTGGIEGINFLGVLKKEHVGIPGINQKRSGIYRSVQEKFK